MFPSPRFESPLLKHFSHQRGAVLFTVCLSVCLLRGWGEGATSETAQRSVQIQVAGGQSRGGEGEVESNDYKGT